jgi:hypothetical protein
MNLYLNIFEAFLNLFFHYLLSIQNFRMNFGDNVDLLYVILVEYRIEFYTACFFCFCFYGQTGAPYIWSCIHVYLYAVNMTQCDTIAWALIKITDRIYGLALFSTFSTLI